MNGYEWECYPFDWEGCHEPASHALWLGDELVRRYCPEHANQKASELDMLWYDLEDALAAAEPLSGQAAPATEAGEAHP